MVRTIKYLFAITICFCHLTLFTQNSKIDSLLTLLKTDNADTNKLIHLNKLSGEYLNTASYDSAMIYANSALQLSIIMLREATDPKIKQTTQKSEASTYNNIGNVYWYQGNYPEALKNYLTSLKIRHAIGVDHPDDFGNKKGKAASYNNIGGIYSDQGNYPEALKNHFASLKIREATGDKKGIAHSYNNIGNIYEIQGNYPEALKNYFSSLKIFKAIGDKMSVADSYYNIGVVYFNQAEREGTPALRSSKLNEALKNFFASLKIRETIDDKKGIADSYLSIGNVNKDQGNYPEAFKNCSTSLKIKEAIGDKAGIVSSYINIGEVFTKMAENEPTLKLRQAKYKEAEEYFIKAKDLSKENGYKEWLKDAYRNLTNLDSAKGNYKGAYENHKLYILYRDSLDNEETRKKTIQSQMTFDFEKKEAVADAEHKKELENQKALAEEKSRKQKIVLFLVLGSLFLVLIFAGFIFRSLRTTRKQKNIIEEQKKMVEEKQKEIIDSITYARRIQRSLLPTEKYIDRTLKRLLVSKGGNKNN